MFLKLQDGEDQFLYNERTGEIFQVHTDNVRERLEVSLEQLSRFRPNLKELKNNMTTYEDILKKLSEGNPVYLLNRFYNTAIKCIPGTTHYKAKHKGGTEYGIESGADLVYDSFDPVEEITAEEYEMF